MTPRIVVAAALALVLAAPPAVAQSPKVGPPRGAVIVVGGGSLGPEVYARFIELAGGPDALIVDVPTAGGDSVYPADWRGTRGLRAAGARNVVVLHTVSRTVADADSFVAPLKKAGGVWFEGGRQWHLVDSYAGTKTERAFHDVLARGGVVGGSSAGASILASYLLRGAREGNTVVMAPGYEAGFGFLRGVAIDQHVVARERLRDLADSLIPRHPDLLGISEDEGTAWVVRGDTAEIVGRGQAFVYGGRDATDAGKPFLTLHPGDRYDLGARHVMRRAIAGASISEAFVDSLLAPVAARGRAATVLVAQGGRVLVDKGYGVAAHPRYMPATTVPEIPLGEMADVFHGLAARLLARDGKLSLDDTLAGGATVREYLTGTRRVPDGGARLAALLSARAGTPYPRLVDRRVFTPIGAHKTVVAIDGRVESNVDELYRLALALESPARVFADTTAASAGAPLPGEELGWRTEPNGRLAAYAMDDGRRGAFVRVPARRATVIVLTDADDADARGIAGRIADRLR
ncbi:peptidase S51 dipeptidase E (plasmid) [Gemmatirosa kalamazoonensis]|uniref:Peptidase S51 dipeptidase E n=1 Tax=Gemmatirosa kalamazoonensis TaxID=861299 RepID=W0RS68_9BACT|nr:Type 1 glutamine amidotransferase-like domain-containing protein [Gemmatirosa kalamazoonensis]AHG93819.1 peptidase S51 dipeptidase E [Gemmatirosa kalamazoonensis]